MPLATKVILYPNFQVAMEQRVTALTGKLTCAHQEQTSVQKTMTALVSGRNVQTHVHECLWSCSPPAAMEHPAITLIHKLEPAPLVRGNVPKRTSTVKECGGCVAQTAPKPSRSPRLQAETVLSAPSGTVQSPVALLGRVPAPSRLTTTWTVRESGVSVTHSVSKRSLSASLPSEPVLNATFPTPQLQLALLGRALAPPRLTAPTLTVQDSGVSVTHSVPKRSLSPSLPSEPVLNATFFRAQLNCVTLAREIVLVPRPVPTTVLECGSPAIWRAKNTT